jgi:hypothetical protein
MAAAALRAGDTPVGEAGVERRRIGRLHDQIARRRVGGRRIGFARLRSKFRAVRKASKSSIHADRGLSVCGGHFIL